jgi:hypothetical protein
VDLSGGPAVLETTRAEAEQCLLLMLAGLIRAPQ